MLEVRVLNTVALSSRGQIVIPVHIRKSLGLLPGSKFQITVIGRKIILIPETTNPVDEGLGLLKSENSKSAGDGMTHEKRP